MGDTYEELERQLFEGKITPSEFIEKYNKLIEEESKQHVEPFNPHEHI